MDSMKILLEKYPELHTVVQVIISVYSVAYVAYM